MVVVWAMFLVVEVMVMSVGVGGAWDLDIGNDGRGNRHDVGECNMVDNATMLVLYI